MKASEFEIGSRWFCERPEGGRARFWFVVEGPGSTSELKTSYHHKLCRIEVHPDDMALPGGNAHGMVQVYAHKHIKKYAKKERSGGG